MKAIILAAGRGSRLNSLTKEKPKCMVELHNKPLLSYQLAALNKAAISEIALVGGYQVEKIPKQFFKEIFINSNWGNTNMVYSLMQAHSWLEQEACIISYSDIFYESTIITNLANFPAEIAISYDINFSTLWKTRFVNPLDDLETFQLSKNYDLLEIGNKPVSINDIQGQFMGLIKITPPGWKKLFSLYQSLPLELQLKIDCTRLLQIAINANIKIKAIPYNGTWGEVDHPNDLELYETLSQKDY